MSAIDPGKLTVRRRGIKLCLLVSDSNSCRSAYRFMKAFLVPNLDEVHLVTAVTSESGRSGALTRQRELIEAEAMKCAHYHVAVKEEEYTLFESLGRYVTTRVKPDIIFMGSTNLCTTVSTAASTSRAGGPAARVGTAPRGSAAPTAAGLQLRRQTSLSRAGAASSPNAVVAAAAAAAAAAATGMGPMGGMGMLGSSCLALKVLSELRCAPVLLAKYNSRGPWLNASASAAAAAASTAAAAPASPVSILGGGSGNNSTGSSSASMAVSGSGGSGSGGTRPGSSTNGTATPSLGPSRPVSALPRSMSISPNGGGPGAAGQQGPGSSVPAMRVMVDLQPNSRHVLDWLFEHFTAGRDHLVLTVSQAYDDQHNIKPAAQRLLTAFGVQAAVNSFEADTAVLAGPANKSLPQAVMDSEPDLLVLQAPRCKGVPATIVELLYGAKTSFLIWPPDYKAPQH